MSYDDQAQADAANNKRLLHETGPGTLMGQLLRQFWHPVANSASITPGSARPVQIMHENLTIYRGESGTPYLIDGFCAHRRTALHTGWIQGEELRCMYHGWRFNGQGKCTDIPAETRPRSHEVRIKSYPVLEYAGLIFAYLGKDKPPEFQLPRKDFLEEDGRHLAVREAVWDCNWFQQVENSLDAVHLSFCHVWGKMSRFGEEIATAIPELSYLETSAGIRQIAQRAHDNVRISNWTFPNNNHVIVPGPKKGDPWVDLSVWAVPIDDHRTMRFTVYSFPASQLAEARRFEAEPDRDYNPADDYEKLFTTGTIGDLSHVQVLAAQDYVAVRGQGAIADRIGENLSTSDAGIMMLRRVCQREMEAIRTGRPTKHWLRLEERIDLPTPGVELSA